MFQGEQKSRAIMHSTLYSCEKQNPGSEAETNVSRLKQQHNVSTVCSWLHHFSKLHGVVEYVTFFSWPWKDACIRRSKVNVSFVRPNNNYHFISSLWKALPNVFICSVVGLIKFKLQKLWLFLWYLTWKCVKEGIFHSFLYIQLVTPGVDRSVSTAQLFFSSPICVEH